MGATTSAQDTKGGKPPGNGVLSETLPKDCLWFLLNSTKIIASGAGAASAYARSASSDATPTGLWMSCTGLWPAASGAALTLEHIAPSSLPLVEDAPLSDLQRDMLFKTRRSTRAYKDEPVDRNVLLKALEEARYAPTASNCEEVAWLLVEGRDRLHDLASRVADWMSTLTGKYSHVASAFRAGQDPILRGAPSLILAHGDANMPWNALDCAAAVSYLELALHSYGIGTCWSGFVIAAASNGVDLGIPLPEGRKICGGLMIGYPAVQYARVPPRKPVRLTVIE